MYEKTRGKNVTLGMKDTDIHRGEKKGKKK
jgi:hypothetical protein